LFKQEKIEAKLDKSWSEAADLKEGFNFKAEVRFSGTQF